MRSRFGGVREAALRNDGDPTIRAMTHYVEDRNEVKRLFDGIAYSKCKLFYTNQKIVVIKHSIFQLPVSCTCSTTSLLKRRSRKDLDITFS